MRLVFAVLFTLVASAASAQIPMTGGFCEPGSDSTCMRQIPRPSDKTIEAAQRADALKPPKPPKIHALKPPDEPHLPWWAYFIPVGPLNLTPLPYPSLPVSRIPWTVPTPPAPPISCMSQVIGRFAYTNCF